LSSYTFNFSSKIKIESTDEIWIKFPRVYDPYLGKGFIKYQWGEDVDTYYTECTNTIVNSAAECSIDHWYVRVFNMEEVNADTTISITIKNVLNPAATTETADF
jgi:hypothetical protein